MFGFSLGIQVMGEEVGKMIDMDNMGDPERKSQGFSLLFTCAERGVSLGC